MGIMRPRFEINRAKLKDLLPLDTPLSVTIVPSSHCIFSCTFCPSRTMTNTKTLSFSTFKDIIDNAQFPQQPKLLSLYNVGEPLLNDNLFRMVSYAKKNKFSKKIGTVTNAYLLTPEISKNLINSGIDRIIISLYGLNNDDYYVNTKKHVMFDIIYENIKYLNSIKKNCEISIKVINRVVSTPKKKKEFIKKFENHCTFYSIEPVLPIWPNFKPEPFNEEDNNKGLYEGVPAVERTVCHYPFYSMVITSGGIATPCLANWKEDIILGDASITPLNDIWNSEDYLKFRMLQLSGNRTSNRVCATCGTLKAATATEDNLDSDRQRLYNKLFGEY